MGYLTAVKRYCRQPRLRRYTFSTIAWYAMRKSVAAFQRAEARQRTCERRYAERTPERDPMQALALRLLLHELASAASRSQYALALLRMQGYSAAEAARLQGMTPKRVRRLLRGLYQAYFQLYPNELEETK